MMIKTPCRHCNCPSLLLALMRMGDQVLNFYQCPLAARESCGYMWSEIVPVPDEAEAFERMAERAHGAELLERGLN